MNNKQPNPHSARPVVEALQAAIEAVRELSARRLEQRLSVARLLGVTRELQELIKVMSVYGA